MSEKPVLDGHFEFFPLIPEVDFLNFYIDYYSSRTYPVKICEISQIISRIISKKTLFDGHFELLRQKWKLNFKGCYLSVFGDVKQ